MTPFTLKENFLEKINDKWYQYYEDKDSFSKQITGKYDSLCSVVEKSYQKYLHSKEDERLGLMLRSLNNCKNFDEQCSLFCKWANSEESSYEDMWIVAVGTRLMDGKLYSPILFNVWLIWRPLCQSEYFGISRDSEIPNKFYNKYRSCCFTTCLKYITEHPDDIFAMNCASVFAGRGNIFRKGSYPIGNQSAAECFEFLPNRYKKELESTVESSDKTDLKE